MIRKPHPQPYILGVIFLTVLFSLTVLARIIAHWKTSVFLNLALLISGAASLYAAYGLKLRAYASAKLYLDAASKNGESPFVFYNCAVAGLSSGDKVFALEQFETLLKKFPGHFLSVYAKCLADKLRKNKKIKRQELCFSGELFRRENKLEEAKTEFQKEISLNPSANLAYYGLALVYSQQSNLSAAKEYFDKFKKSAFNNKDIRIAIAKKIMNNLEKGINFDVNRLIFNAQRRNRRLIFISLAIILSVGIVIALLVILKSIKKM